MRVGVIGTGHVGLVTCGSLASLGHHVVGTDSDAETIAGLRSGILPFYEPGLQELIDEGSAAGRLDFVYDASGSIAGADIVFICVGTPPRESGDPDLAAVERAARYVARCARGKTVLVEKSTVPAGTAEKVRRTVLDETTGGANELEVVSNPEFLREGTAVRDALHPDRILIGAESPWALGVMRELYEPLIRRGIRFIETDINTAELAKHASNAFLALKISYANALARICEHAGADVAAIADVLGSDPRIGRDFLSAGLGYGGSCLPKDLQAFDRLASRLGYDFPLLREVSRINDEALDAIAEKVRDGLWNIEGKKITLLGLAFKPETDDVRFSPSLTLARRLISEGALVTACDPQALANAKEQVPELEAAYDAYDAASGADCLVVCTEWPQFRELDLSRLRSVMANPLVVDGRNIFDPHEMRSLGFTYYPTGRPAVT